MHETTTAVERSYEPSSFRTDRILWFSGSLLIALVVAAAVAVALLGGVHPPRPVTAAPPTAVPALAPPLLQPAPAGDLRSYRSEKSAQLEGYAWADKDAGLARVPIERAMQILAAQGASVPAPSAEGEKGKEVKGKAESGKKAKGKREEGK